MRKLIFLFFFFLSFNCFAQADTSKWLRAFPITNYMVELNDSMKVVQLKMPDGHTIKDQQLGLIRGVYKMSAADTVQKGYGRCYLIKGDYYYFSIGHNTSGVTLKEGDLLYTFVQKPDVYCERVLKLASHFIELQNVYENPLYDTYTVFYQWAQTDEEGLIDSIVSDIRFTGKYFSKNNPSMDKLIKEGQFKGKKILYIMTQCQPAYVKDFLDYMIARPRLYAGRKWKISEVFATWASEGSPTVIKN
jgi:hypothetical protein